MYVCIYIYIYVCICKYSSILSPHFFPSFLVSSLLSQASVPCEEGSGATCNIGDAKGVVIGFFMMLGIPIYAAALGKIAQMILEHFAEEHQLRLLHKPILPEELMYASEVFSPSTVNALGCSDYIVLELMRCGITNPNYIHTLAQRFNEIDVRKTGYVMIPDLINAGLIASPPQSMFDENGADSINNDDGDDGIDGDGVGSNGNNCHSSSIKNNNSSNSNSNSNSNNTHSAETKSTDVGTETRKLFNTPLHPSLPLFIFFKFLTI